MYKTNSLSLYFMWKYPNGRHCCWLQHWLVGAETTDD